jgi:hypothetical protein
MCIAGAGSFGADVSCRHAKFAHDGIGWTPFPISARGHSDSLPLSSLTSTYALLLYALPFTIFASLHFLLTRPANWTSDALPLSSSIWTYCFLFGSVQGLFCIGPACRTLCPPFPLPQLLSHLLSGCSIGHKHHWWILSHNPSFSSGIPSTVARGKSLLL